MNKGIWISIVMAAGLFANNALAGSYVSCDSKNNMDFSDAGVNSNGNGYAVACHSTDRWQGLGDTWETDRLGDSTYSTGSTPTSWTRDQNSDTNTPGHDDASDDGVTWRTSSDGGLTWTDYSSDNPVTQGDLVEFKFEFSRSVDGNHKFDELKAWVDWDQENGWDNSTGSDEIVQNVKWYKYEDANGNLFNGSAYNSQSECTALGLTWNNDTSRCNNDDDYREYTVQVEVPEDALLGTTWMRARVVCENSLTNYTTDMVMDSHGFQDQGEVEDYAITVLAKQPPVSVPEPTSLLMLSSGLLFLAGRRRIRK